MRNLKTSEVAERWQIPVEQVRRMIRRKELRAFDTASGSRHIYRVREADLAAYEQANTT